MNCYHWIGRLPNKLGAVLLLAASYALQPLQADHYPGHAKLEWGLGMVALSAPDYLGTSRSQNRFLPFPYIKYRGDFLYIDEGIEGRLFQSPNLLLAISGNGSLPSPDDNPEREGMHELDATFELGPSLEYRAWYDGPHEIWLELPLRYGFRINGSLDSIGRTVNPRFSWRQNAQQKFDWKLEFTAGVLYADDRFHGYFYNVDADEITANRPAFAADGGRSGLRFDFTYSRRFGQAWLGGFFRYDNLDSSEIESSPLVNELDNLTAGISLAWIFSEH